MDLILIVGGAVAVFLGGMATYHSMLKRDPARLQRLLDRAKELGRRA